MAKRGPKRGSHHHKKGRGLRSSGKGLRSGSGMRKRRKVGRGFLGDLVGGLFG